jgi:hypothetical protein
MHGIIFTSSDPVAKTCVTEKKVAVPVCSRTPHFAGLKMVFREQKISGAKLARKNAEIPINPESLTLIK